MQGASYGYTRKLGYHPLLAVRSDTGEVLHIRNRKGKANTQRGAQRFVDELLARVRRAGHAGAIVIRADIGYENHKLFKSLDARGVEFSIGVKHSTKVKRLIEQIPDSDWVTVADYPEEGEAQVAEVAFGDWRLIVRRTRIGRCLQQLATPTPVLRMSPRPAGGLRGRLSQGKEHERDTGARMYEALEGQSRAADREPLTSALRLSQSLAPTQIVPLPRQMARSLAGGRMCRFRATDRSRRPY